jgi:hypothetical protein
MRKGVEMIFEMKMAYALELIALVAGVFLLLRACGAEACCRLFARIVAWFVIAVSAILIICTAWHNYLLFKEGCMKHGGMGCHMGGMMPPMLPGMGPMGPGAGPEAGPMGPGAEQMGDMVKNCPLMKMMEMIGPIIQQKMEEKKAETK